MVVPLRFEVPSPLAYFAALVAEDEGFSLLEAAIVLAQDDWPELDPQSVMSDIDGLAERLRRRLPADASALHRVRLLNRFFYRELGFAANTNDFHDPANSFLHHVLQTRRGIPVSLAVLYIELAQQIGLVARGVSFPGHFLVKLKLPDGEVVLDPVNGESLTREMLDERLEPYRRQHGLVGDFDAPLGLFLQPATAREIIARMLGNLKTLYSQLGDLVRLLAVQQRLVCLLPAVWEERRDRGRTLAELGQRELAMADLAAYLEHRPRAVDEPAVSRELDALEQRPRRFLH